MGLQSVLRVGQERTRSWQQGWGGAGIFGFLKDSVGV